MSAYITNEEIVAYYDDSYDDYRIVWHVDSHMSLHYGYWDETTRSLRSALVNMNRQLASIAGIRPTDNILDAGCGVGGSSIFLAKEHGCEATGITLSAAQVDMARANALKKGVQDKTRFEVADFTKTPYNDATFDVVWGVESICHANQKADFLNEAYRLLKPGGVLIVADFFRTEKNPSLDTKGWMKKWANSWAIPDFEKSVAFSNKAREAGFLNVDNIDITKFIYPSAKRLYQCLVPGIICDGALRLVGKRNRWNKANVWSTLYQYRGLQHGFWDYRVIKAIK